MSLEPGEHMDKCPICLNEYGGSVRLLDADFRRRVICDVCGIYVVERDVIDDYLAPGSFGSKKLTSERRARLSHLVRKGQDKNNPPEVSEEIVERIIRKEVAVPNPALQASNVIRYVGDYVSNEGEKLPSLPVHFYAEIGSPSPEMAAELTLELVSAGYLTGREASGIGEHDVRYLNLTLSGWERYEAERHGLSAGNYAFIALKFNDPVLDDILSETIKPRLLERIGYQVVDMRDVSQAGLIDNIMRQQIRDAVFVIADLTHDNSGAYWEAGYAEGLGKPVIYICEQSKFDEGATHFDTNHCTTVTWSADGAETFAEQLIATVRRSLGLFPNNT